MPSTFSYAYQSLGQLFLLSTWTGLLPLFCWVVFLFLTDLQEFFIYSECNNIVGCIYCKHLLLLCVLPFHFSRYLIMKSNLSVISFMVSFFCVLFRQANVCLHPMKLFSYIILSSICVILSPVTIRSMIHLKYVFAFGVRKGVRLIDLASFIEKTMLLLHSMCKLCDISEVYGWICFWSLYSIPLVYCLSYNHYHTYNCVFLRVGVW